MNEGVFCLGAVDSAAAKVVLEPVLAGHRFSFSAELAFSTRRIRDDYIVSSIDFGRLGTGFGDHSDTC
jgi:hypothetical protein